MSEMSFKKILDAIIMDDLSQADLKKMGLTKEEYDNILSSIPDMKPETYKRVMNSQERNVITPKAFGYMVKLVHLKTITKEQFEKIINISLQLYEFIRKDITVDMIDVVLNYVVFTGLDTISIKEIVEMLYIKENDNEFDNSIN